MAAVAIGLQNSGRIIMTAAAGVLAVTFIAFAASQVTFIKLFGVLPHARDPAGRHIGARGARAGAHAAGGGGELVGAAVAAASAPAVRAVEGPPQPTPAPVTK